MAAVRMGHWLYARVCLVVDQHVPRELTELSRFLIGGVLSDPAAKWPNTVGRYPLFHRYPYFLPCVVAASVSISSWLIALLFLKEVQ
jgi:hypothetical protein